MTDPGKPPADKQPDENERLQDGTINRDPREGTRKVKNPTVARVLTVRQILDASEQRAKTAKDRGYCTTGHWYIDEATGGMMGGDCWLLGADTSVGKSSFAIMLVDVNLKLNRRILIVTSEDDESLYGDRLMCRRSGINAKNYRNGNLTPEEWELVAQTRAAGEPIPVYMDARESFIEDLDPQIDAVIKQQAIDLVVFDYLQEFRSKRRWQDERIKYKEIAAVMRRVVKRNKKCGLILSQLTMTENTKIPSKRNIRETRDVSNAAETILILFIPENDIKDEDKTKTEPRFKAGSRVALIDKCKRGPRGGMFGLKWDDTTASFGVTANPDDQYDNLGDFADDD